MLRYVEHLETSDNRENKGLVEDIKYIFANNAVGSNSASSSFVCLHIQKKEIETATDCAMNTVEGDRKTSSADFEGDQSTKLGLGIEVDTSS